MIIPLFTYCSIVTCHKNNTNNLKIQSLENRAKSVIFKRNLEAKNLPSVSDLMKRRLCEFVYKCLKSDVCEDFENYFELMGNKTRNKNSLIRIPVIKLECTKKSFYFSGASIFNSLPINLSEFLSYF